MPEYLSPGVYVEEVNTGSKPIEGVSTSTAGMVGVTERGPENIPILVTSYGEYQRIFGGDLDFASFLDINNQVHAYLPHAVQGFFSNDGRRNYVVRVLPNDADHASRFLFDRGRVNSAESVLLRHAPQGSGTAVNTPFVYALNVSNVNNGDWLRVGEGSRSEYRQVNASAAGVIHAALGSPLGASYAVAPGVEVFGMTAAHQLADSVVSPSFRLAEQADRGDISITLNEGAPGNATALASMASPVLEIGSPGVSEFIRAVNVVANGSQAVVELERPLSTDLILAGGAPPVRVIAAPTPVGGTTSPLALPANAGDLLIYPANMAAVAAGDWLVIGDITTTQFEVHQRAALGAVSTDVPAYVDYPARSQLQLVTLGDGSQTVNTVTSAQIFTVNAADRLEAGMTVSVQGSDAVIQSVAGAELTLVAALPAAPVAGDTVTPFTTLTATANAGAVVVALANRVGLEAGRLIRIGVGPDEEYMEVAQINGVRGVSPDSGNVVLRAPLAQMHAAGTRVVHQSDPAVNNSRQAAHTVLAAEAGATSLFISDETGFAANEIVRITTPGGGVYFHRLVADATAINPGTIELAAALNFSHEQGSAVQEREPLIDVRAIDRGAWGNRLLVAAEDAPTPLVQAELTGISPPQVMALNTFTGVEAGTVLELIDPLTGAVVGAPLKVAAVDRAAQEIELDGTGLDNATHVTEHNLAQMAGRNLEVRSREVVVYVFLLQRPDPAVPSRNSSVIASESFLVSMDSRHSRYIHRVIGTTWTAGSNNDDDGNPLRLWDRRSEGESAYIRVRDVAAGNDAITESVRLGPEALIDLLDSGQQRPARLPLRAGDDSITTMTDAVYEGVDSDEPRLRTGIHALRNMADISIVAVPGQTRPAVQRALINHCESDRYRFAVLDAHGPNRDTLADVQNQRQLFDTKYAALYHPWLHIPEPRPANIATIRQIAIPPSGHIIGIYARTDNARGVHKAPANEVVRGITGLARKLNSREQDILNPFPKNINVIRDFRESNRGLRVWGARCITSDSDYKYVNVRRLMIFLEASIDQGLQWVVFEPSAEELWARVRRAITNFLTVVWRNGALEGTTVEQAFFVKCDRTTMTQTDIDEGRLICVVGVAPVKPAEFVIVRIGLWTASAQQ